jgi:crotonobetainyl-CoA:carnitine CoA-transferase CaiB-like acyl-CoA transferase
MATQSGILAAALNAEEFQRLSGGVRVGRFKVQLVWPALDGYVAILYLFGPAFGPFTHRLMEWIYEEGGCDEATRDKNWLTLFNDLFTGQQPMEEYDRLKLVVDAFVRTKTKAELLEQAMARRLLVAPVTTIDEVVESDQLAARDYWRTLGHAELGQAFRYPGAFAKFSLTPIRYRRRPPTVGEHNHEIYVDELGVSPEQLADLRRQGVV